MVLLALIGWHVQLRHGTLRQKAVGFFYQVRYAVFPYSETVFFGNGCHWDFYADLPYDQRYQPDAVGRQYVFTPAFLRSVYCIWCRSHGIYRGYKETLIFVITIPLLSFVVFP